MRGVMVVNLTQAEFWESEEGIWTNFQLHDMGSPEVLRILAPRS
jgi:hypothetical protein